MITHDTVTRRRALEIIAGSAAAGALLPLLRAEEKRPRKVLFFTKSSGFEHSVVKRDGDKLGLAETVFTDLGKKHGFEVMVTKDGGVFDKDLAGYDVFFFYTSGNLLDPGTDKHPPMTAKGKEALLDAVKGGKGFMGSHCASDTFHSPGNRSETQASPDPYIAMLGGEFIRHGPQQKARVRVIDQAFPGQKSAGPSFEIQEEWYSNKNFAPDLHVLHVLETKGMEGDDYERPPFPLSWARMHGKGRVFFTSLGHREDVWTSPMFQEMLTGAVAWCAGDAKADVTPNLKEAAPENGALPPERKRKKKR
jgi:type 1 glutamine amidotransferase